MTRGDQACLIMQECREDYALAAARDCRVHACCMNSIDACGPGGHVTRLGRGMKLLGLMGLRGAGPIRVEQRGRRAKMQVGRLFDRQPGRNSCRGRMLRYLQQTKS